MLLVIILGRLPFVRDFPYPSIFVTEFCHKSTISSLSWSLVKLLKIKVMPILYIDCLDCKMTTLNAPLHLNAYNFSKRIYNLYLQIWWHQVKTGWLGEQGRWSEFCVLISYQVFYSLACSLCSPPRGGTPGNSRWRCAARFSKSWLYFRPKKCHFSSRFSDVASIIHPRFHSWRWSQNATLHVYIRLRQIMSSLLRLKP